MALVCSSLVLESPASQTQQTRSRQKRESGNPTECVSKSCVGPLHRHNREPTTLRVVPVIVAALPHAANAKYPHGPRAGISETGGITPAGRSILLGPPRRHSDFPASMPAIRLPSLSYPDGRTTPRGLPNISFGAGANPDAPQDFILLLKNDASAGKAVAARAYTSRISSPIFDPGKATTLDFWPGSDPDPPESTWATARTTLTAPADETDTLTVPSRVGTTISGAPPGRPNRPIAAGRHESIFVIWTAPSNSGPAITGYDVQYRITGTEEFTVASYEATVTQATITGLARGKRYEVQVRANNADGNGEWSQNGPALIPG